MKKGPIFAPSKKKLNKFATKWKVNPSNLQTTKTFQKQLKTKTVMKKMMSMAFAAVMGMMMSSSAMASSVAPTNPTEMNTIISEDRSSIAEVLETRTMIHTDGNHTNKFVYVLNEEGVVKSKTMYTYNSDDNKWTPVCIYRAVYGEDNNMIIRASWNSEDNAYTSNIITATYSKSECPVLFKLPNIINY